MRKLFVYSLPRSGSTLFQKYIYRNKDVATVAESWILLPLYYMFKRDKTFSEYEHTLFNRAYDDLRLLGVDVKNLSSTLIKSFSETYYSEVSFGAKVFIDKTPRYSIICLEIIRDFPEDQHVILFRHPLSCVSSMVETFGRGSWCLYRFDVDLLLGLENMIQAAKICSSNVGVIRYEDFVSTPDLYYARFCEELGLDPENTVELHSRELKGTMGDPLGENKFGSKVGNVGDMYSWSKSFNTIYRRIWAKRFVKNIGRADFRLMGYDYDETLINIYKSKYSLIREVLDFPHILLCYFHRVTGLYVTYIKLKNIFKKNRVFGFR
jgi:hypothetical protein